MRFLYLSELTVTFSPSLVLVSDCSVQAAFPVLRGGGASWRRWNHSPGIGCGHTSIDSSHGMGPAGQCGPREAPRSRRPALAEQQWRSNREGAGQADDARDPGTMSRDSGAIRKPRRLRNRCGLGRGAFPLRSAYSIVVGVRDRLSDSGWLMCDGFSRVVGRLAQAA